MKVHFLTGLNDMSLKNGWNEKMFTLKKSDGFSWIAPCHEKILIQKYLYFFLLEMFGKAYDFAETLTKFVFSFVHIKCNEVIK